MKKTKLLSLIALTLIGLLGLSSCGEKGEKGDTGATGPAGETGPKGDKGDPGENGEDGKDGATWLTGTSKPADALGNLGDMYLNTTNGDVYQKEESGWTLKMNIKGEDGEDGEDGLNGSTGSQGKPGETAYSNTILPIEGGYITSNVGSAIVGEEVTFTFVPTDSTSKDVSFVWDIKNNGNVVYSSTGLETTAIKMMEGGFVVSGKVATSVTPTTSDGSLKVEVPSQTTQGETIVVNVSEDLTASEIEISGNTKNNPVVIDGTKKDGSKATLSLSSSSLFTNLSDLTFNYLVIESKVTDVEKDSLISVNSANGSLNLNNVDFKIPTTDKDKGVTDSLVKAEVASISMSGVNADFANQNNSVSLLGSLSTSVSSLDLNNINVEGVKGTAIHIQKVANNADFDITDSTFDCESNFLTLADYDKTIDSKNKSVSINLENLNINDNGKNPVIMFNLWQNKDLTNYSSQDSASYFDVNVNNLTHNGVKLTKDNLKTEYQYNNVETENTVSTLAEGDSGETASKPGRVTTTIKGGLLAVFDACWGDGSYDKLELIAKDEKYPKDVSVNGVKIESKASNFVKVANVEGDVKTAQNVFINGQLYSEVTYSDNNGDKIVLKGTAFGGIKFAGGDGSETNPLQIETAEQWNILNNDFVKDKYYYFILNKDIDLNKNGKKISSVKAHINLNGHSITLLKSSWSIQKFGGSIKNGIVLNPAEKATESFIFQNDGDILLEGITIGNPNKDTYVNVSTNTTIFLGNVYKDGDCDVVFRNCTNYVDYGIKNDGNYGGAFIGGCVHNLPENSTNPVLFENCINYGDFKQQNGAAFVGNSSEITDKTYKFINCKNYGDITGTKSANVYVANTKNISDEDFIQKYKLSGIENFGNVVCGNNLDSSLTFSKNEEGKLEVTSTLGEDYQNVTYKVDLEVVFDWKNSSGVKIGQNRSHQVIKVNSLDEIDIYVANLDISKVYTDSSIEETSKGYVKLVYDEDSKLYKAYVNNTSLDQVLEGSYIGLSDQEIKIFITILDENGNPIGFTSVKTLCDIK